MHMQETIINPDSLTQVLCHFSVAKMMKMKMTKTTQSAGKKHSWHTQVSIHIFIYKGFSKVVHINKYARITCYFSRGLSLSNFHLLLSPLQVTRGVRLSAYCGEKSPASNAIFCGAMHFLKWCFVWKKKNKVKKHDMPLMKKKLMVCS